MKENKKHVFEKMIDRLDTGKTDGIASSLVKDHNLLVTSIQALGELDLRQQLNDIHTEMTAKKSIGARLYWAVGIAATIAAAVFWWQGNVNQNTVPTLQMNEMPIYGDSASYDSLKNVPQSVDIKDDSE